MGHLYDHGQCTSDIDFFINTISKSFEILNLKRILTKIKQVQVQITNRSNEIASFPTTISRCNVNKTIIKGHTTNHAIWKDLPEKRTFSRGFPPLETRTHTHTRACKDVSNSVRCEAIVRWMHYSPELSLLFPRIKDIIRAHTRGKPENFPARARVGIPCRVTKVSPFYTIVVCCWQIFFLRKLFTTKSMR